MGYRYNPFNGELDLVDTTTITPNFPNTFKGDTGTATPAAFIINLLGDATQGLVTSAGGNTVTFTNSDATEAQKGVLALSTAAQSIAGTVTNVSVVPSSLKAKLGSQTQYSVPYGDTDSNAVQWTSEGNDGQLVIAATGAAPAFASLTSTGATITITAGTNTLNLEAAGGLATTYNTNSGIATPAAGILKIEGDSDQGTVTSGAGNTVTAVLSTPAQVTAIHGWNGSIEETAAVTVTSDGATITCSVEQSGGGNLTVVFSDGFYTWVTAPDTVTLTAGSDTSPQINYVYFLQSTKTLTVSTSAFPATEYAPIATVLCQSAASLQTDGAYKVHAWTDHVIQTNDQGHIGDLNFWIRQQPATWASGVLQTYTITPGPPDNVILTTAAGVVLQLHDHTFPAFAGTPDIYVVNDSVTPYTVVTDLNAIAADSTGATLVGRFYSLVIWGCVSEDTGDCKLFCNLPSGSYNNSNGVTTDADNFADYSIPSDFTGTGFLISEWKLRQQAAGGGTFTSIAEVDLRGLLPSLTAGGGGAASTEFADNTFRIFDDSDSTKELAFQVANVTTATTRTITMVDADLDLATVSNSFPTDLGTAAPTANVLSISGGTGINTGGATTVVTVNLDVPVLVASGGTGATTLTDGGILLGSGTGAITATAQPASGQLLIGSVGADPVLATLTAGVGIVITEGAGTITIDSTSGGMTWNEETGTSATMVVDNGYIANNAGLVTLTLPATAAVGEMIQVDGKGAGGWLIAQNAGQTVHFLGQSTTAGAGGSLASTTTYDCVTYRCITANTTWVVETAVGNLTVV